MRIDLTGVAAATVQAEADPGAARRELVQRKAAVEQTTPMRDLAPLPVPRQEKVSVSVDAHQNTIYRYLDQKTGDLIQQVPPEELLRVMRNIGEYLQASQRKLNVTL